MDSFAEGMEDSIDFEELRSQLFHTYQQQTSLRKSIVQLSSIFYGPTPLANMATALNYLGINTQGGKPFTPSNLRAYVTPLIKDQVLIYGAGHLPQCHPLLVELVTRNAVQLDLFDPMLEAVKSAVHPRRPSTGRANRVRHICRTKDELYREARFAFYAQDYDGLPQLFLDYSNYNYYATAV
ncbi:MAG: ATP-dependent helicase, partial [Cyanobacteria bacterium J06642_11]